MPRLLDQAKENVDAAPRAWTERAIRECEGALTLLDEGCRSSRTGRPVQSTAFALVSCRGPGGLRGVPGLTSKTDLLDRERDEVAVGEEALALHLNEGHFLEEDAAEIERYARAELAEATAGLAERATEFGAESPGAVLAQLKAHRPPPRSTRAAISGAGRTLAGSRRRRACSPGPSSRSGMWSVPRGRARPLRICTSSSIARPRPMARPAVHDYLDRPRSIALSRWTNSSASWRRTTTPSSSSTTSSTTAASAITSRTFTPSASGSRIGRMAAVDWRLAHRPAVRRHHGGRLGLLRDRSDERSGLPHAPRALRGTAGPRPDVRPRRSWTCAFTRADGRSSTRPASTRSTRSCPRRPRWRRR